MEKSRHPVTATIAWKKMIVASFWVNVVASSDLLNMEQRLFIYQQFGLNTKFAYLLSRCFFAHPSKLSNVKLGERCFFNHHVFIENGASITLGNNVCLGPGVKLLTTTHRMGGSNRRVGNSCVRSPILIEDGCWIGAGVTILPGVRIGKGCVIGAGAVVTKSCKPDGLYIGVDARRIKDLAHAR